MGYVCDETRLCVLRAVRCAFAAGKESLQTEVVCAFYFCFALQRARVITPRSTPDIAKCIAVASDAGRSNAHLASQLWRRAHTLRILFFASLPPLSSLSVSFCEVAAYNAVH